MVNYLTAARMYVDHRRTHLTQRYGRRSEPLRAYEDALEQVEANSVYWFVWELRNFVQHCGMLLQVIRDTQRLVEDLSGERIEYDILVGCSRPELLARYSEWGKSLAFLQQQPEEFAILPLLEEMTELLDRVEHAVIQAILPQLWRDAQAVEGLLSEAMQDGSLGLVSGLEVGPEP